MTARELSAVLASLGPDEIDLPVVFVDDDYGDIEVETARVETRDERGGDPFTPFQSRPITRTWRVMVLSYWT
jgi:hypothetical protein